MMKFDVAGLAETLRMSPGFSGKRDISFATASLVPSQGGIAIGDDCAAIPDGDEYLLFAIEGFINEFVERDPWFAGWCGIMVNLSDVAAMGGRAIAVVDALWAQGEANAEPVLQGLRAAAQHFDLPIVGGHTNLRCAHSQLSVAILGRARTLLTSFAARPGDRIVAAIDLRGNYRPPFLNFEAATKAPATRLRGDLELLPEIAEAGLASAAKDISQGGLVGTAAMLAECSRVAITIDVSAVPKPAHVALQDWLLTFPSYGYLLAVPPDNVDAVIARFHARDIAAAEIGAVTPGSAVIIKDARDHAVVWDRAAGPLIGPARQEEAHA